MGGSHPPLGLLAHLRSLPKVSRQWGQWGRRREREKGAREVHRDTLGSLQVSWEWQRNKFQIHLGGREREKGAREVHGDTPGSLQVFREWRRDKVQMHLGGRRARNGGGSCMRTRWYPRRFSGEGNEVFARERSCAGLAEHAAKTIPDSFSGLDLAHNLTLR